MKEALNILGDSMSSELGIDSTLASRIVDWLDNEGMVDYGILRETYGELVG